MECISFSDWAGAWLLIIGGLGLVFRLLTRPLSENHSGFFSLFLCFLISCISLAELHFPYLSFFNEEVSLGGVFGRGLISSFNPLLGKVGTGVFLWSSFMAFALFYGQAFFPFLLSTPKKLLIFLFVKTGFLWKKRAVLKTFLLKLNPLLPLKVVKKLFKSLFFKKKHPLNNGLHHSFESNQTQDSGLVKRGFLRRLKLFVFPFKDSDSKAPLFHFNKSTSPEASPKESISHESRESKEASPKESISHESRESKEASDFGGLESLSDSHVKKELKTFPSHSQAPLSKSTQNSADQTNLSSNASGQSFLKKTEASSSSALSPSLDSQSLGSVTKKSFWSSQSIPPIDLLMDPPGSSRKISPKDIEELSKKLLEKFQQFSIQGEIKAIKTGPALVLFEYKPEDHVKVSQIRKMESDLSLALSSESIRIIAPIPGRDVVGIEASMPYREMVYLKNLLKEKEFFQADIPLVLGRRADNKVGIKDLARIPHLLVAGSTGSGKSMFIISFISSLLFRHSPESLKLLLIDPKQVDLSSFKEIPHLLAPIISSASSAVQSLYWSIQEMEKRYRSLAEFKARDYKTFNQKVKKLSEKEKSLHRSKNEELGQEDSYYFEPLPLFCLVVEEFGDLMADPSVRRSIENAVVRLAQKARASGIHLVLAMQSPRKDVVTGLIKTNIPGRISFKVASGTDSRIILDDTGAERLLSHGDMLFLEPGSLKATRYHGPFMRDQEVSSVVSYWKSQSPEDSFYAPDLMSVLDKKGSSSSFKQSGSSLKQDSMYNEILEFVKECDVISASLLQRKFQIGYPRAGRIIQDLFDKGQIGPPRGSKPREVLISK